VSGVLVIAEHRRGELRPATLELITAAQAARRDVAASITVAVIAQEPERLVAGVSVAGVDEVLTVKISARDFDADTMRAWWERSSGRASPHWYSCPTASIPSAMRLRLPSRAAMDLRPTRLPVQVRGGGIVATRGGYGQKVNVEVDFPGKDVVVLAVRGTVFKPPESAASPAVVSFPAPGVHFARRQPRVHRSQHNR